MAFREHPDHFVVRTDPGIKRPDGARKPKSKLRASRSPIYIPPTTESKKHQLRFLRGR